MYKQGSGNKKYFIIKLLDELFKFQYLLYFLKKLDNRIEHLFNNTVRVNTDYNLLKFET